MPPPDMRRAQGGRNPSLESFADDADGHSEGTAAFAEYALGYARIGWPVFPCLPDGKTPHGRLVPNGVKNATTDQATIRRWWHWEPLCNVAIACGAPGPDVVDIDCKHDAPGLTTLRRLQRAGLLAGACRLVGTPSGGWHVYFAGRGQTSSNLERTHGISLRSTGYYVVAPPSVIAGRAYLTHDARESDAAVDFARIRRFLDPPRPTPHVTPPSTVGGVTTLAAWVAKQPAGNRNNALYWAACRAASENTPDAVDELTAAGVIAGLDEHEARRTVASAWHRYAAGDTR